MAEWISHRDDPVTNGDAIAVAKPKRLQRLARVDPQDRQVGSRIGLDIAAGEFSTVVKPDDNFVSVGNNVIIRHDDAR